MDGLTLTPVGGGREAAGRQRFYFFIRSIATNPQLKQEAQLSQRDTL